MTPISEGRYHGEQGMYLAASGTLTQFNAIMAALLTAALSLDVSLPVKAVIGLALAGHAAAGFLLCWAARPIAAPTARRASRPTGSFSDPSSTIGAAGGQPCWH
jgi:hypothetical protein